ncbi:conserved unknown protein [Ectocarpus siliculosus]|uniref:Uncharacterized protein n=1 Tax=Ectocarpus siliculosus TaxID=2880 RepID=D7FJR2_ECTSI|nr:conserved unknown protein [Ectocarpus siliculosus]|eukprot:CBJ29164.1 conserved unknown protein [Ectocarpus siliculosus]
MPLEVRCPPDGRGTPIPESSTPFWKNLVAGGGAGLVEIACMYPTDVAKTRQQLSGGKTTSMVSIFRDIIQNEGPANLYRGVASPVMAEAPKRAIKFSLNASFKKLLQKDDGTLPSYRAAAAGSLAGMTECSVNTPFEMPRLTGATSTHPHHDTPCSADQVVEMHMHERRLKLTAIPSYCYTVVSSV